jgi:hypothetical protein
MNRLFAAVAAIGLVAPSVANAQTVQLDIPGAVQATATAVSPSGNYLAGYFCDIPFAGGTCNDFTGAWLYNIATSKTVPFGRDGPTDFWVTTPLAVNNDYGVLAMLSGYANVSTGAIVMATWPGDAMFPYDPSENENWPADVLSAFPGQWCYWDNTPCPPITVTIQPIPADKSIMDAEAVVKSLADQAFQSQLTKGATCTDGCQEAVVCAFAIALNEIYGEANQWNGFCPSTMTMQAAWDAVLVLAQQAVHDSPVLPILDQLAAEDATLAQQALTLRQQEIALNQRRQDLHQQDIDWRETDELLQRNEQAFRQNIADEKGKANETLKDQNIAQLKRDAATHRQIRADWQQAVVQFDQALAQWKAARAQYDEAKAKHDEAMAQYEAAKAAYTSNAASIVMVWKANYNCAALGQCS